MSDRGPNRPSTRLRTSTCSVCGQAVRTAGKGTPTYDLDIPKQPHHCEGDSMTDNDPFEKVPRDRYQRPLIKQASGKDKAYTRCTTYVGCLEDTYNLTKWQMRMTALGLAQRDDLLLSVSAHSDDKSELDKLCEAAKEAAAASSGATKGTALHRLAERLDSGEKGVVIPTAALADIAAYLDATKGVRWTHIEKISVHDGLEIAGTPDRIGVAPGETLAKVWDLKTGSIDFGLGKIAMQLAVYAHSQAYDISTGERTSLDVDLDWAVIIHLPVGTGTCRLVEVDIKAGWEAVQLATQVRDWRKRKNLARPYRLDGPTLQQLIEQAPTVEALNAVYADNKARWDDEATAYAVARKTALTALAVAS